MQIHTKYEPHAEKDKVAPTAAAGAHPWINTCEFALICKLLQGFRRRVTAELEVIMGVFYQPQRPGIEVAVWEYRACPEYSFCR